MANDFTGDENCVALWSFDVDALTTDSIGGNTLTDVNNCNVDDVDYKEGDQSVDFDRSAPQEYLKITNANLDTGFPLKSEGTGTFSITFWVKFNGVDSGYVISKLVSGEITIGFDINNGVLYVSHGYNNGDSLESDSYGTNLVTGRWYHIGYTYNNSTKDYLMRIWDDTAGDFLDSDLTGTWTNNIYLGTADFHISGRSGEAYGLWGHEDEVVVFKDILTTDEIDEIRQGTYSTAPPPGVATRLIYQTDGLNWVIHEQ